jgi:hypothetical protein
MPWSIGISRRSISKKTKNKIISDKPIRPVKFLMGLFFEKISVKMKYYSGIAPSDKEI